jgi:hypothetical protein
MPHATALFAKKKNSTAQYGEKSTRAEEHKRASEDVYARYIATTFQARHGRTAYAPRLFMATPSLNRRFAPCHLFGASQ